MVSFLRSHLLRISTLLLSLLFLTGCEHNMVIISDLKERDANEIVVFLASKGISSEKMATTSAAPGGTDTGPTYGITVESGRATEAMAILSQNGLPRKKGVSLLDLFASNKLMTSDKEETIRYQAGLASQIANMIRKIDGVLDADVQLSFPTETTTIGPQVGVGAQETKKITAAVYVKHQGILDDPNSHLVIKIKRLVSGSVAGLDVNDVAVISDRSRFTDVTLAPSLEPLAPKTKEYVSIWSIVMNKDSAGRFRLIFFFLITAAILFALVIGWLFWKLYPLLRGRGGFKSLVSPAPLQEETPPAEKQPPKEEKK